MISQAGPFSDPHHELWTLLEGLCEDRLSAEEFGRLEQWVLSDPAARRIYRDYMELHGSLYWDTALAGQRSPAEIPAAPAPALVSNTLSRNRRWISAALVLVVGIAIWFAIPRGDNNNNIADQNDAQQPRNLPQEIGAEPNTEKPSDRANNRSFENLPWPAVAEKPGSAKDLTPPEPSEAVISQSNDARPEEKPQVRSVDEIVAAVNLEIQQGWQDAEVSPSPVARDSEWLRRVYLDLIGQIPPAEAVERFLSDRRENKRALVVDELLADPAYVRHFATVWTNLLVGRSTERDVDRMALHRFMRESFGRNRPWSEVVADLIAAAKADALREAARQAEGGDLIWAIVRRLEARGYTQAQRHYVENAARDEFVHLLRARADALGEGQ